MKKQHFPVVIEQDEDGIYIVSCPTFQGCRSYGETIDEAVKNITEAIELCIADGDIDEQQNIFIGMRDIEVEINETTRA
ncbi:MAG TPA: type II toxin-antitoxin system HicB family antitoxin [Spirochaetota bacterium]|nr:type II toxin-antitoxin system HicB family antitoxin [Spirochaetota bacterium]